MSHTPRIINNFEIMSSSKSKRRRKGTFFRSSRPHPGPLPDLPRRASEKYTFSFYDLFTKFRFGVRSGISQSISQTLQDLPGTPLRLSRTLPEPVPDSAGLPRTFPEPSQTLQGPPGLSRNPPRHFRIMVRRMCLVFFIESFGSQPTPESSEWQFFSH